MTPTESLLLTALKAAQSLPFMWSELNEIRDMDGHKKDVSRLELQIAQAEKLIESVIDKVDQHPWMPIEIAPIATPILAKNSKWKYVAVGLINDQGEFEQTDKNGILMGIGFSATHWLEIPKP